MKKFIAGIIAGTIIALPVSALAAVDYHWLPWTEVKVRVSDAEYGGLLSTYEDDMSRCYMVSGPDDSYASRTMAISCVKK